MSAGDDSKQSASGFKASPTIGRIGLSIYQFCAGAWLASGISWFIGFALSLAFGIIIGPLVGLLLILIVGSIYVALTWKADTYRTVREAELKQQVEEAKAAFVAIDREVAALEIAISRRERELQVDAKAGAGIGIATLQTFRDMWRSSRKKQPPVAFPVENTHIVKIKKPTSVISGLWNRFVKWWAKFYIEHIDDIVAVIRGIATAMGLLWPVAIYLASLTAELLGAAETTSALVGFGSFLVTGHGALVALTFLVLMSFLLAWSARRDAILTRRHEVLTATLSAELTCYQAALLEKTQEKSNLTVCQNLINLHLESKKSSALPPSALELVATPPLSQATLLTSLATIHSNHGSEPGPAPAVGTERSLHHAAS